MKTGISTAALFPEKNTEAALAEIKELGVDIVEIFFSTFYEYRPEFTKSLKNLLSGIEVNSVHTLSTNFEPNFFNPDRRVRGDGYYWFDQVARSAQLAGCKNYTMHGFVRPSPANNDNFESLAGYMNELLDLASGYGINICLENVHWCAYNRPDFFAEMKKRCSRLSGVFDIKQARRSGYPYRMYLKDMSGSIAYAHLSDVDAYGKMCLPGRGVYDFTEILKALKDTGFDGNLIVEVYRGDFGSFKELKDSVDFLNEVIYKIN